LPGLNGGGAAATVPPWLNGTLATQIAGSKANGERKINYLFRTNIRSLRSEAVEKFGRMISKSIQTISICSTVEDRDLISEWVDS